MSNWLGRFPRIKKVPPHDGVIFLLLFFCSVFKPPFAWWGVNIAMVTLTIALLLGVLYWKVQHYIGLEEVWRKYKLELILCFSYCAVCLLSVLNNLDRYANLQEFIFYGLSPIAIWITFPLAILLFAVNENHNESNLKDNQINKEGYANWLPWGVFLILAIVGMLQAIYETPLLFITQYFVAADSHLILKNFSINSLMRTSTDYGPAMTFATLCAVSFSVNAFRKRMWSQVFVFSFLAIFFFIAAVYSSSNNAVVAVAVGGLVIVFWFYKVRPLITVLFMLLSVGLVHALMLSNDLAIGRYAQVLPYIGQIGFERNLSAKDFIPNLNNSSLNERKKLWSKAIEHWKKQPLLGISGGGYKLSHQEERLRVHNTHNFFTQVLTESGAVGLVMILVLLFYLFRHRVKEHQWLPIAAIIALLQFDYYLDHSLPWIIIAAWTVINSKDMVPRIKNFKCKN